MSTRNGVFSRVRDHLQVLHKRKSNGTLSEDQWIYEIGYLSQQLDNPAFLPDEKDEIISALIRLGEPDWIDRRR
jgi:hypothetical protein